MIHFLLKINLGSNEIHLFRLIYLNRKNYEKNLLTLVRCIVLANSESDQ